ncbi:TlpA family protein disulfide reductase [Chryseobacterium luquanense]|uniref:TlpA family protein disulfide reductase n=1 Tax=Chryseobacterium luquanense TaxID=2983766 RepID=A0ABT3Y0R7_9FLAO|nr:TlpA disulfide reductase family protein [Chryseobacterium luquanense]MCX8531691.1 TlpA family protein disulfide reductase [Chryseobacterium luquanense]
MKAITLLLITISLFIAAQQRALTTNPSLENKIGKHFPIENYKNKDGKNFTSDYLKDKPTFINFWSTTCEPCIEELPYLNKLRDKFENKVKFIAITHDNKEKVDKFLIKHELNFQHITDSLKELQSYFKLIRNPMTFIIDKNGNIQEITGTIDESKFDRIVKVLSE